MSEFLTLLPPQSALQKLLAALPIALVAEEIATTDAAGRVTAHETVAPFALPSFARSTVDGFAVRASDTFGASEGLPAYLQVVGEVPMGGVPTFELQVGQCGLIHTGGMLPAGADAVAMVEYTQTTTSAEIELLRAVSHGENVLQIGEDVRAADVVIEAGVRLGSAEIGGLSALGYSKIAVTRQPRVAILSSGDEVVPPNQSLKHGQIYDINSYSLKTLVEAAGGIAVNYPIIRDEGEAFRKSAEAALAANDLVIFTAGSSVSVRDLTAQTIDALGEPGVLVHGVSVRPGKPTILAVCSGKPVIGLPGNPVSALVIARLFVLPVIEKLLGLAIPPLRPAVTARLTTNLSSQAGREDWVPVRLVPTQAGFDAEPVFGKSNLIFTLIRADGLLKIHPDANGIAAGTLTSVELM